MGTATPVPEPKKESKVSILVIFLVIFLLTAIGLEIMGIHAELEPANDALIPGCPAEKI